MATGMQCEGSSADTPMQHFTLGFFLRSWNFTKWRAVLLAVVPWIISHHMSMKVVRVILFFQGTPLHLQPSSRYRFFSCWFPIGWKLFQWLYSHWITFTGYPPPAAAFTRMSCRIAEPGTDAATLIIFTKSGRKRSSLPCSVMSEMTRNSSLLVFVCLQAVNCLYSDWLTWFCLIRFFGGQRWGLGSNKPRISPYRGPVTAHAISRNVVYPLWWQ